MKFFIRLLKNTVWVIVYMAVGILYFQFAPIYGIEFWLGFVPLAAITWIIVSKLRERLRF